MKYQRTLTIAGSDSGGGAGIQADLKTFSALGCYGTSVVTALTAQNTLGVESVLPISAEFVVCQFEAVMRDIGADAIKLGMLHDESIVDALARSLAKYSRIPVVLDPVMIAKGGHALLKPGAVSLMRDKLFPLATVVTPNLPEAEAIVGRSLTSPGAIEKAAREILLMGPQAVLIKGGHGSTESCDDFYLDEHEQRWLRSQRVQTKNTHGTGCTLSAAIAAYCAQGFCVLDAVVRAKAYLSGAIASGSRFQLGAGHGPVDHNWRRTHD